MSLEKAFVGTVCVDMGFFLWNGFSPSGFCCDIMKKTRNKAIDEEIKYFPIFPNLSHAQNMKYFVQIEVQRVTLWWGGWGKAPGS